jgi:hypothetical protein
MNLRTKTQRFEDKQRLRFQEDEEEENDRYEVYS